MKTTSLLAIFVAVALPLAAITAEDSSKTEATDQKQEQGSDMKDMKDMKEMKGMMGKCQMMSNLKDQDADVDKLVAEMNNAPADKKLDTVVAVLNKLVEQRKAMHEQMEKMMSGNEKKGMGMCRMMMGMDMGDDP